MRRDRAIEILSAHATELTALGVKSLALFGSVARDEAREDSDVDLLIEFEPGKLPKGLAFFGFYEQLENWLDATVDNDYSNWGGDMHAETLTGELFQPIISKKIPAVLSRLGRSYKGFSFMKMNFWSISDCILSEPIAIKLLYSKRLMAHVAPSAIVKGGSVDRTP